MSVLIKETTLPDSCWDCEADFAYQIGCELWQDYEEFCERRHPDCPLVEIPTPHGRLIDADELCNEFSNRCPGDCGCCGESRGIYDCGLIINAPTILEAEE